MHFNVCILNGGDVKRFGLERLISILLMVAVLSVFSQMVRHDFINYDDGVYVTNNSHVRTGLSIRNISWAFTTMEASNWHPLTWLSHMLDCQLYGLNPTGHYLTNLFFHMANVLLLFLVLRTATGRLWESAMVAALFALHPLHVESVAWVSERKDVLSAFFWMLTILAYLRYIRSPGIGRYVIIVIFFASGLMAKPMLVTLPFVLLLLDFWPLGRLELSICRKDLELSGASLPDQNGSRPIKYLILEKTPLFLLSVVSSIVTYVAQSRGETIAALKMIPITIRCLNGCLAYVQYLWKMIWPSNLAIIYPHPVNSLPVWSGIAAGLFLVLVLLFAIRYAFRYPFFLAGWLWYMGTLIPVIGIVQVGVQSMADRYTYLPSIGIFIIFAWSVPRMLSMMRHIRLLNMFIAISASTILICFSVVTWLQLGHWQDTEEVFRHAVFATRNNHVAHCNLGNALLKQNKLEEAFREYERALEIWPRYPDANNNLGLIYAKKALLKKAMAYYKKAIQVDPRHILAHLNMADALTELDQLNDAVFYYNKTLVINPDLGKVHNALGVALAGLERMDEAIAHLNRAIDLCQDCPGPLNNLGRVFTLRQNYEEAIDRLQRAIELQPGYAAAYNNLGLVYVNLGSYKEAVYYFASALHFKPDYIKARDNLKRVTLLMGHGTLKKILH